MNEPLTPPSIAELRDNHIEYGVSGDCMDCPVATAIGGAYHQNGWKNVIIETHNGYTIIGGASPIDPKSWSGIRYSHSKQLNNWIESFDSARDPEDSKQARNRENPITIVFDHKEHRLSIKGEEQWTNN